jgi:hypothetical protein
MHTRCFALAGGAERMRHPETSMAANAPLSRTCSPPRSTSKRHAAEAFQLNTRKACVSLRDYRRVLSCIRACDSEHDKSPWNLGEHSLWKISIVLCQRLLSQDLSCQYIHFQSHIFYTNDKRPLFQSSITTTKHSILTVKQIISHLDQRHIQAVLVLQHILLLNVYTKQLRYL